MDFVLKVNPQTLSTAQQKGNRPYIKDGKARVMYFTKQKVARSWGLIEDAICKELEKADNAEELQAWESFNSDKNVTWFMSVEFIYKPESLTKKMLGKYKTTGPDGDNLMKLIPDVITKMKFAWVDDSQMQCNGIFRRYVESFDEEARILVNLEPLVEGDD